MSILFPPAARDFGSSLFDTTFDTAGLSHIVAALFNDNLNDNLMEPVVVAPSYTDISANTVVTRLEAPSPENCVICQDQMRQGEEVRTIRQCSHLFHRECIDEWFRSNVRCPHCRVDIRTNG